MLVLPGVASAQSPGDEPFAGTTKVAPENPVWAKWRGVEIEINRDLKVLHDCRAASACPAPAMRFLEIIDDARHRLGRDRIEAVNNAVNGAIGFMTDWEQWGVADRWSAPLETFSTRFGDCEDFAIAKHVALGEAGMAADDLRLVVVQVRGQPPRDYHVLSTARDNGHWLLLDTLRQAIVDDVEATEYTPRFVIDHRGVREYMRPGNLLISDACVERPAG
jgi:predicted transglutaminase-like cysteine proteinase